MALSCLFCAIAAKEMESHLVYEDEWCVAFLDIRPIRPGHTLVVPKQHAESIHELDGESYIQLMQAARLMSEWLNRTFQPKKVGMAVVGFDQNHLHIHLIPLEDYHDLTSKAYIDKVDLTASKEELKQVASRLRNG
ncbi:HIT domain-containing protein [Bacillus sp. JCM 19041]|uniref:HIT family protein n=1 Tax=Bacillus sp. JCM 19041 TaxID=1460637 RepID=UPI0006D002F8